MSARASLIYVAEGDRVGRRILSAIMSGSRKGSNLVFEPISPESERGCQGVVVSDQGEFPLTLHIGQLPVAEPRALFLESSEGDTCCVEGDSSGGYQTLRIGIDTPDWRIPGIAELILERSVGALTPERERILRTRFQLPDCSDAGWQSQVTVFV